MARIFRNMPVSPYPTSISSFDYQLRGEKPLYPGDIKWYDIGHISGWAYPGKIKPTTPEEASKMETPTLFTSTEGSLHIDSAILPESMRHYAPLVVADAMRRTGTTKLSASSNLSKHSSALVKKARSKGLTVEIPGNPEAAQTNMLTFPTEGRNTDLGFEFDKRVKNHQEVSSGELSLAKTLLREISGRPRKEKPHMSSPQFNQPKLPGMEDY